MVKKRKLSHEEAKKTRGPLAKNKKDLELWEAQLKIQQTELELLPLKLILGTHTKKQEIKKTLMEVSQLRFLVDTAEKQLKEGVIIKEDKK